MLNLPLNEVETIARLAFGEPNKAFSNNIELRFGAKGSVSINLTKCTWFNHETATGGGLIELVIEAGLANSRREAFDYIQNSTLKTQPPAIISPAPHVGQWEAWFSAAWARGEIFQGSLAETYLANRGVTLPPNSEALKFFPNVWISGQKVMAMGAAIVCPRTGKIRGLHRTHITFEARKGELGKRLAKNSRKAGGVIMLSPQEEISDTLGIGEGIETTLSLQQLQGYEGLPVWSLIDSGNLSKFEPIERIKHLIIAVDNDDAGIKAANECAESWKNVGVKVTLIMPPQYKSDLNDYIKTKSKSSSHE